MFTIKAMHESGPVWIGGISELHTVESRIGDPLDWLASKEGQAVLDRTGDQGVRITGRITDQPWSLLRVVPAEGESYNLIVPADLTFILNEAGATIDRI